MVEAAGVKGCLLGLEYTVTEGWTCPCAGNKATGNGSGYDSLESLDTCVLCTGITLGAAASEEATVVVLVPVAAVVELVRGLFAVRQ